MSKWLAILSMVVVLVGTTAAQGSNDTLDAIESGNVRFATFNASLNRFNAGSLISDLTTGTNAQARAIAEIIQRVRPDVLLINEFDYDAQGLAAQLFQQNYLAFPQGDAQPIHFPFVFQAPSNTGIPTGLDLDNDGSTTGPGDAQGFGFFPGQFGMLILSRFPILTSQARTFQNFLWASMPGALLPDDAMTAAPADYYSPAELAVLRLSSKSHWDVPIMVHGQVVHVLAAHPTPPVFDGPEDRNGLRNHDEIRFWADYVTPGAGAYIVDDNGNAGGLGATDSYVILGDYNADPVDGDSVAMAACMLLDAPRTNAVFVPRSSGGAEAAALQGGANANHIGNPLRDTSDFSDVAPGNLRVDYVLPSNDLHVFDSGIYWPRVGEVGANLVTATDHRLTWIDTRFGPLTVEFLGEATFPTGFMFNGTNVGGLSGVSYVPAFDVYVAISDDRSQLNPARYYAFQIDLSDGHLDNGDVNFLLTMPILTPSGLPYAPFSLDPEGIAITPDASFLVVSSEGDANAGIDPFVNGYLPSGHFVAAAQVPSKFLLGTPGMGIRNNLAFESLAFSPLGTTLFTATENSLQQDGPAASVSSGSRSRVLVYSGIPGLNQKEFAYDVDRVTFAGVPAGSFTTNGLVELLVLNGEGGPFDTLMLSLERSFSTGVGNEIKLYALSLFGADDISGVPSLATHTSPVCPIRKELVFDLSSLGLVLDNVEGMTLGPILPDGRRTLILCSDNNFSATQFTQFLAFALPLGF